MQLTGALYAGMQYANGEFIQIHPTAIPGPDKITSYFPNQCEGKADAFGYMEIPQKPSQILRDVKFLRTHWRALVFLGGNVSRLRHLVPRDIGSREILRICALGLGADAQMQVYLDVSHLPEKTLKKVDSVLDIYEKFTGTDRANYPCRSFPLCIIQWAVDG